MGAKYLPEAAAEIAGGQGWSDSSIIMLMSEFIESVGQTAQLTQFLSDRAADENDENLDEAGAHESGQE